MSKERKKERVPFDKTNLKCPKKERKKERVPFMIQARTERAAKQVVFLPQASHFFGQNNNKIFFFKNSGKISIHISSEVKVDRQPTKKSVCTFANVSDIN